MYLMGSLLAAIYSRVRQAAIYECRNLTLLWRQLHSLLVAASASTAIRASLGGRNQGAQTQSPVLQGGDIQARGVWHCSQTPGAQHSLSTYRLVKSLRMNILNEVFLGLAVEH